MTYRIGLFLILVAAPVAAQPSVTATDYNPLTGKERWDFYWKRNFANPGAFFRAAGPAVGDQLGENPPEWEQGLEGYGKRVASRAAVATIRGTTESAGAALLKQDPRYVRCGCDGFWKRFGHAVASSVMTYDNDGDRVFAAARVGSAYAGSFSQLAWFPDRYSWKDGFREGSQSTLTSGGINLIREFGPDLKRLFGFGKKKR